MKGLKVVLWICGVGFLLSFPFLLVPWRIMADWCGRMGVEIAISAPVAAYMTRGILVCCGLIGVFFVILAKDPLRYGPMLPLAGYGFIFAGLVCLAGGIRYDLPFIMFGFDVIFCVVAGKLILVFRGRAIGEQRS
jgi:hypothetical protein